MGTIVGDTLARLRVCRDSGLATPPELRDAAIECLERYADAEQVRAQRDTLIRRAALLLPPAAPYRTAGVLACEARAMNRRWHELRTKLPQQPFGSPRDYLHAARLLSELPTSQRQFYRVLLAANDADMVGAGGVSEVTATIAS
ncbi:hypothetical protein ACFONC_05460 [Luteimonas soli]|uniref:Uncharacterized protein n=1 Tax=Luteimonas soli TaxID=1648966 RepID=A0ABV7XII0_9GAMM